MDCQGSEFRLKGNSSNPDFRGYVTRYNVLCSDGRTICPGAFKDDDGKKVPLVYNHEHSKIENVIGHAILRNRNDGVYADCYCNDTNAGKQAKSIITHGDVDCLSIYANRLIQNGSNVMHGMIREVSLVLAGANPKAYIDDFSHSDDDEDADIGVVIHADEDDEYAGVMFTGDKIRIAHSAKTKNVVEEEEDELDGDTVKEVLESLNDDQVIALKTIISKVYGEEPEYEIDDDDFDEIVESLNDDQAVVFQTILQMAIDDAEDEDEEEDDSDDVENKDDNHEDEEDNDVKHNVFNNNSTDDTEVLSHSEMAEIIDDIKRYGSLKESFLQHGVEQIDMLIPEPKLLNTPPDWIKRDTGWVAGVMSKVHRTPFSRIKSMYADITADEARAKGYIKGNLKKEEVFSLLKRTTTPKTIYKKQKFDRDDLTDITDFDFVAWIKAEMRFMLDEELARAILVGDGRLASDDDKINEENIRPVAKDHDLYTIKATVPDGSSDDELAKNFIIAAIKARIDYKGSGSPILYTTEEMLTNMLLITDKNGRDIYTDDATLARKLRVSSIVTVPVMEGIKGPKGGDLLGVIVNLNDYNLGADRGGAITMFDDFDIDYNAQKYLIETRCSGALIKPYSAISLEKGSIYTTTGWGPETRRNLEPSSTPSVNEVS